MQKSRGKKVKADEDFLKEIENDPEFLSPTEDDILVDDGFDPMEYLSHGDGLDSEDDNLLKQ